MKAFIFDTETSGLVENRTLPLDKQPEIIEFFGHSVDLSTGKASGAIETFLKPRVPISDEIKTITGITNEMLEGAPRFSSINAEILANLWNCDCVLAHNLSFDMEMVDIEQERLGIKMTWPPIRICTVEQTVHLLGYRLSLSALHAHLFGQPFDGAHRARIDVEALTRCAVELFKRQEI